MTSRRHRLDRSGPEPGCYIDSHHGHYAIPAVIQLAQEYGRPLDAKMVDLLARYDADSHLPDYPGDAVIEESDAATEWLNDNVSVDGHMWDWNDGDFGLYPIEEDE
jgi:hypothetical protein